MKGRWKLAGALLLAALVALCLFTVKPFLERSDSLYSLPLIKEVADVVAAHTDPDQLIYCNQPTFGKVLGILAGRATTQQIRSARLIVWIPKASSPSQKRMEEVVLEYHLRPLGKTTLARIFLNLHPQSRRQKAATGILVWVAFGLIVLAVGGVGWTLKRRRHRRR